MRALRVATAAPDGASTASETGTIVVAAEDGEQFSLTIDDALVQACGAHSASTAPAGTDRPVVALSPREIQTRIRAGESPDDLAAETGMDLAQIMRFGYAVMQERFRVGDEARRGRARRDGDGALVPFGETVDRRFAAHGIEPASVHWDAFRRPDGSWTISATWNTGATDRHAYWAFSLAGRTVLPVDEPASDLLSDRPLRAAVRAVPDVVEDEASPDDGVYDQENPQSYPRPRSAPATEAPNAAQDAETAHNDGYGTTPLPLRLADPLPVRLVVAETVITDVTVSEVAEDVAAPENDSTVTDRADGAVADGEVSEHDDAPTRRTGRDRGARERTKVPSWEDIYLGVKRNKD